MLTKAEEMWIAKLQALLDKCPSSRLGAYTIGDSDIGLFDQQKYARWCAKNPDLHNSSGEFGDHVQRAGAFIQFINFPFNVESTSG